MSRKKILYACISVVIIAVLSLWTIYTSRKNTLDYYIKNYVNTNHLSYQFALVNIGYIADIFYKQNEEQIGKEYSLLIPEDPNSQAVVRENLLDRYTSFYENQRDLGLKQLHFHLANGDSLLRVHRPHQYGDNLLSARKSVAIANKEQSFASGFEEGRIFNGFRYVYPILYKGEHLGSFECGFDFSAIKREMKKHTNSEIIFAIRKDIVEKTVFKNEFNSYKLLAINDNFYIGEKSEFKNEIKESNLTVFGNEAIVKEKMKAMEDFTLTSKIDNKIHLIHFMPISNINNKKVAYIISSISDIDPPAVHYQFYLKNIIWIVFLLAGLVFWIQKIEALNTKLADQSRLLLEKNSALESALNEVKVLQGIIPICCGCKKIRNDTGYYEALEEYFSKRTEIDFSHTLCPECTDRLYNDEEWYQKAKESEDESS